MRIATVRLQPAADSTEAAERLERAARAAREAGADLLVAPARHLPGDPVRAAQASDGPFARVAGEIAARHRLALVVGMAERAFGHVFDALLVFDARGHACGHYRRVHLLPGEEATFTAGAWGTVARIGAVRAGLLAGVDLMVPEFARALVLCGAELLLGADTVSPEVFRTLLPARAVENGVAVAWAARSGPCGVALPDGRFLEAADGPAVAEVASPPDGPPRPRRRPRLYRAVCEEPPEEDPAAR
ncbi:(R)-stereoselective amidase [bacterium HR39]|nr:(R)-stereoselective amidase [bacterium HR39]